MKRRKRRNFLRNATFVKKHTEGALPTKEAHSVAVALRARVFAIFGSPRVLVSDNGSEFVNEIFANLLDVYKTVHRTTVAYHPSSNGLVERRNGTLGKIL